MAVPAGMLVRQISKMRSLAALVVLGISVVAAAGWRQAMQVRSFSDLPKGDSIRIDYRSSGCFSQSHYSFVFRGGESGISARRIVDRGATAALPMGRIPLARSDVKGLDRLLDYYRHVKGDNCTTVDTVTFVEMHGNREVARETHVDATCSQGDTGDVPSLASLLARFQRAQP